MEFDKPGYHQRFTEFLRMSRIVPSDNLFKIKLFLQKGENSLQIAKFHKDIQPNNSQPQKLHWNYWAIIISYYSMLYAAKAAILYNGYEVKDHDAAQTA